MRKPQAYSSEGHSTKQLASTLLTLKIRHQDENSSEGYQRDLAAKFNVWSLVDLRWDQT